MAGAERDLAAALLRHAEGRARAAVGALREPTYAAACYRDAAVVRTRERERGLRTGQGGLRREQRMEHRRKHRERGGGVGREHRKP